MPIKFFPFFLFLSLAVASPAADQIRGMTSEKTEEGILIRESGLPVLHYQAKPKSVGGKFERSNYIHPLYDLGGVVITEDFPEDHLHQRGIFWTWHQVLEGERSLGDGWECRDIIWDVVSAETQPAAGNGVDLLTRVLWKSPEKTGPNGEMVPFVEENSRITVHPREQDSRKIDFSISLRSLSDNIRIGGSEDEKGYGGFSPRVVLPEDVSFRGINGDITPRVTAVSAGPAVDITGSYRNNEGGGIAVIQHPSNPGFIQGWILRAAKSMQNPAFPGSNPVPVPRAEPLTLKYRIILHGPENLDLEKEFRNYSSTD